MTGFALHVLVAFLLVSSWRNAHCASVPMDYSDRWRSMRRLSELETPAVAARRVAKASSKCPAACTVDGTCNEELGRCDCPRHLTGPACNKAPPDVDEICEWYGFDRKTCGTEQDRDSKDWHPCLNSCHLRGKCIAGICHCEPGYWGGDCALSLGEDGSTEILAGQKKSYVPRKGGVKIYVYDLPGNMTSWYNFKQLDRPLHLLFWQRLMSAGVLTTNGEEADYFYIPLNPRGHDAADKLEWVVSYIRKTWPYWDRDGGHKHLIIHTGDLGVMEFSHTTRKLLREVIANITWMTHWGMHTFHPIAKWEAAHRPGKDIVIPVLVTTAGFYQTPYNPVVEAKAVKEGTSLDRKGVLFFAGRVCGDRKPPHPKTGKCSDERIDYSANVRQRVYEHHHKRAGYKIAQYSEEYWEDLSSHKFCLAPTGGGHGKRQVLAAVMGCIPVTITDGLYQPFEPELKWSQFSVPVAETDIPKLPKILEQVTKKNLEGMQKKLRCAAQHMWYSSILGAIFGEDGRYDAFETILEILRVRKEHPGALPERYAEVDERFRKFMNCELGDADPTLLCAQGNERQHPDMPTCIECHKPVSKLRTGGSVYSWPGGAICCSEMEVTSCPRTWP